jgi:hypothetical protein
MAAGQRPADDLRPPDASREPARPFEKVREPEIRNFMEKGVREMRPV